ncbi:IS66 family insertion sequence element accessory protein TnpB [Eubacteriaceae bacterium ES3]|nr:IS66 family insertion sequence element accessory protein TnpB [Eubacteriaceae bacterium ES3]WKY46729.1 IS66 family insertion sequence element accessory protein TnpB [Eubacteriaceae bacterium ES3]WKY47215.1 IS66 family insertion sequence element accessory protein TnpB [Eubacteriaceae bacterium ES3]WKY47690.1 IS66 family insertion sequence element accessory protein TnpB [Eubacteriaceae bacterium ES3]WKY49018.1 IS66 family insertion sequence element accessory protein TnpB [Eubacteriaceae bacter
MLTGLNSGNVHIALGATDLRKSIDGLSLIVREVLKEDPFSMHLFAFCNKRRNLIKILVWDQTGFWIHYKRLENGCFQWPEKSGAPSIVVTERSFRWLLDGLTLDEKQAHPPVKQRILI